MYRYGTKTEQVTISMRAVPEIVHALEAIEFLEPRWGLRYVQQPASDGFSATIEVAPCGVADGESFRRLQRRRVR